MNRNLPDKAIASFERVLQVRPGDVSALVWLGDIQLDQGRPEVAGPLFEQVLSRQPTTEERDEGWEETNDEPAQGEQGQDAV